jgi:DNA polymerase-1
MCGIYEDRPETLPWTGETKSRLRKMLDEGRHWAGANLKYDLNWLLAEGVLERRHLHNNTFHDVLLYAALLDETQDWDFYSLDGQCAHYDLPLKPMDTLLAECERLGLKKSPKVAKANLWQMRTEVVADYLVHDITMPRLILEKQFAEIAEQKLEWVAQVETKLLPVICLMEQKGIPVDEQAATELSLKIGTYVDDLRDKLRAANNGHEVSLAPSLGLKSFLKDQLNIELPKTDKGNDKCDEATLKVFAPYAKEVGWILAARKAEKIRSTFCNDAIKKFAQNGRIHANINQLLGADEDGKKSRGVRFGRFSSSLPNLQQVPKRDSAEIEGIGGLGTAMRRLFVAEKGRQFMSADYAAQEPRWIIHWAETWHLPGAKKVGDLYRNDPTISSHDIVARAIKSDIDYKKKRNIAKAINLGKGYEMGKAKLIEMLVSAGAPPQQADAILAMYEEEFPYVRLASRSAMEAAKKLGYVRTYLGRKSRFELWEPIHTFKPALRHAEAKKKYAEGMNQPIQRHKTYTALNRVVQGSSGDQSKMAIVELFYTHGIVPSLQVHDELCDADADEELAAVYKQVMESVIDITVPNLVEISLGGSWGGD